MLSWSIRKCRRGELIGISLLNRKMKNDALPTADILVNAKKCTNIGQQICVTPGGLSMLTADRKTLKCCGQSRIQFGINDTKPVHVEALVIDWQLLGFNLILRNNTIRMAGGVTTTSAGKKATVSSNSSFCGRFDQMQNHLSDFCGSSIKCI